MRSPGLPFALLLFALAACDGASPTGAEDDGPGGPLPEVPPPPPPEEPPTPAPSGPATIRIQAERVVTLNPGEERTLVLGVWDAAGNRIEPDASPTWRSASPEIVEVEDGTLYAGPEIARYGQVVAELGELRDSVGIWIQPPESEPSAFEIRLVYSATVPQWWRSALETAAERWEEVIRAPLPAVDVAETTEYCVYVEPPPASWREGSEDGVRIYVDVSDGFPPGTYVRATGGVCSHRGLPRPTSVTGGITLNADYFREGPPDDLAYLTHHEMGHALGLVGHLQGEPPPWFQEGVYSGRLGRFGHYLDEGAVVPLLAVTHGGHWEHAALMGSPRSMVLTHKSVGALMDMGYPAAWYGAGPIE